MLSKPLSPAYAQRCLIALREFAQPGDGVVALCPSYEPMAACGLCHRQAIYRCFPVQNTRTGAILLLGEGLAALSHRGLCNRVTEIYSGLISGYTGKLAAFAGEERLDQIGIIDGYDSGFCYFLL